MKRCYACLHPQRAAIDADLLQGISYRTVAARYDISAAALHRHRSKHLFLPTVGDLRGPATGTMQYVPDWLRWDGRKWQPCDPPDPKDVIEVSGRPVRPSEFKKEGRVVGTYTRKTYRLRRSKLRSTEHAVGDLLGPAAGTTLKHWLRWDGNEWQRCDPPNLEDVIEMHGRPEHKGNIVDPKDRSRVLGTYIRKTYRPRRSRRQSS